MQPQDILYIQFTAYINTLLQLFFPLLAPLKNGAVADSK